MTQWLEEKLCVLGLDSLKTRGPDGNFHIAIGGPGNEKAQLYDFSPTNEHPRRSRRIMLAFKKGTVLDNVFSQLSWNCWIETQVLLATMLHDITLKSTIHGKNMFGSLVPNHQRVAIPSYAWEHMKEKQTAKTNSCWSRQMKHLLFVLFCVCLELPLGVFHWKQFLLVVKILFGTWATRLARPCSQKSWHGIFSKYVHWDH